MARPERDGGSNRRRRVGIVGGTFDPIHVGHLAVAQAALRCAGLDEVLLVPAATPPHRPAAMASAEDRLAMARLAVDGLPRLRVSEVEIKRPGPSYTRDTLEVLAREMPDADLYLVLGWDAAREIASWHRPRDVLGLARLVIVPRPGVAPPSEGDLRRAGVDPDRAVLCDERTPDVAATRVRQAVARGESIAGQVAPAVARYIQEHGLYSAPSRA